jgi:TM2 domain-containing membrane protein YozV
MSTPDPVRIGNQEREAAVRELGEHFAEGRLDPQEYEERASAAYAARTADELAPLFRDLPRAGAQPTVVAAPPPYAPPFPPPVAPPFPYPAPPTAAYPVPYVPGYVEAPFGREPATGIPYSERQKVVAGVLQLLLPFGVGRFYTGHIGTGLAQLLLSFVGIGVLWAFLDGLVILLGRPLDGDGRPLRP